MKVGLVIQGPLRSRTFECLPVLRRYQELVARLTDPPACCLSTWEGEEIPREVREWGWSIVQSVPPAGWDLMNRRRQILSTRKGVEALLAQGVPDYVLKLRTDMELPLEQLLAEIAAAPGGRLLFPAASHAVPFYLNDFFFGGAPGQLREFLSAIESFGDLVMMASPESDFPLKYLAARQPEALAPLTPRDWFLDPFDYPYLWPAVTERLGAAWRRVRSASFHLASSAILTQAVWRGRPLVEQYGIHEAEFGDFERFPDPVFGVALAPLTALPRALRATHFVRGRLEYLRYLGVPLPPVVLTKVFIRANRGVRRWSGAVEL
jgi:hypothetical protein